MSVAEQRKTDLLSEVAASAATNELPYASAFIEKYCNAIDAEDFIARDAQTWRSVALDHLKFGSEFQTGAPKMRIFTPSADSNTIIEFVNDDMPFLVDSILMEINRQAIETRLLIHPLFATQRDDHGALITLVAHNAPTAGAMIESWIHVEIERVTDPARVKALGDGLVAVLADVRAAVQDWPKMQAKVGEILTDMGGAAKIVPLPELEEARAFLLWVGDNHFTYLGYRDYELAIVNGQDTLKIIPNSGLGILREPKLGGISASFNDLPPALRALARQPRLLVLTKANSRATVHRPGYLDYIGVKKFDVSGQVLGERRFIGLYTPSTYHANLQDIPLLRQKTARVIARAGFPPASHAGKNLFSLMETYPRDELFQISDDELFATAMAILGLGERARTRLFVRRDVFARFYSCLIYLPRESYNTEVRIKLQAILLRAFAGTSVEFNVQLSESALARIHMLVRTSPKQNISVDLKALEDEVIAAIRRWEDGVFQTLTTALGEDAANAARREFVLPFPAAYREDVSVAQAVQDFAAAQSLSDASPIAMSLYETADGVLRFRLYSLQTVPLSSSLPMLENMGVRVESERSYVIARHHASAIYLHDFGLSYRAAPLDLPTVKTKFENAFAAIWHKRVENDGFNRLTLAASLASDEIVVIRTYAKYLKQVGFTFSQSYIEQTLANHAPLVNALIALFHARFEPVADLDRAAKIAMQANTIERTLDAVANADEDRILRRFLAVIQATLRTNYYQRTTDGKRKSYLSVKLESAKVPELPAPRPLFEIFVYSPRFEGIHLRGGKVARGGLRWSDRLEDFRTEVLALVKAQMVKNAVIVPVGSKGGFVLKAAPSASDREAYMKEGVACYQDFLRGLLDLTDNLVKGAVVPPRDVVRHDSDDPYLVVAADKGTATFSDYANAISAEYGHWLGDAFASGGSVGYDHKKMGITAKGAWESVKRHFREMGIDTQTTDFTVAGVGDMSGDVFGNGMLLSEHIRLVAAFDHRHIFLDPAPDAAASFKERQRLFNLPRSSWDDYAKPLISKGGGVFARTAKSIALTAEVKQALGIDGGVSNMTPQELMRAILVAPVDLFYNGGIGTYVKASAQSHTEVGDRANDAIRVDGNALRCKAVAEGGNLGVTQLGRIEAAMNGVRINTDAIDNSAGVDCSDHEVNIKILLDAIIDAGELKRSERDAFLASMTHEVSQLVLKDNYGQMQSLAVSGMRGGKLLDAQARFIRHLEKAGRLNRAVEYLPSDDAMVERKATGLTAPECAVLLAYSKLELFDALVKSDLVDDEYVAHALVTYFPTALQKRFAAIMPRHALKREIIATEIANSTINRSGSVFVYRMREETGATAAEVTRAYILARDVFAMTPLWNAVDALDNKIATTTQSQMLIDAGRLMLRGTLWFLRRRAERLPIAKVLEIFAPGVSTVTKKLTGFLSAEDLAALTTAESALTAEGVPAPLATSVARLDALYAALDIVEIAQESKRSVELAAAVYFALVGKLQMRWIAHQASTLPSGSHWQSMARAAMRDDLANLQRQLTLAVLMHSPALTAVVPLLAAWEQHQAKALARMREVMADLQQVREVDLAQMSVLLRELRGLV